MRCICCDKQLSDYETSLRGVHTGHFLDTCMGCIQAAEIPYMSLSQSVQQDEVHCIDYDSYTEEDDDDFVDRLE